MTDNAQLPEQPFLSHLVELRDRLLRALLRRQRRDGALPDLGVLCEELGLTPLSGDPVAVIRAALAEALAVAGGQVAPQLVDRDLQDQPGLVAGKSGD